MSDEFRDGLRITKASIEVKKTGVPPIIERLDALREKGMNCTWETMSDVNTYIEALTEAYPELRAELLRLQAERDERDATIRVLRKQRAYLIPEGRQMRQERDALLEALRASRNKVRRSSITSNLSDGFQLRREALDIMSEAIASAEGKDG